MSTKNDSSKVRDAMKDQDLHRFTKGDNIQRFLEVLLEATSVYAPDCTAHLLNVPLAGGASEAVTNKYYQDRRQTKALLASLIDPTINPIVQLYETPHQVIEFLKSFCRTDDKILRGRSNANFEKVFDDNLARLTLTTTIDEILQLGKEIPYCKNPNSIPKLHGLQFVDTLIYIFPKGGFAEVIRRLKREREEYVEYHQAEAAAALAGSENERIAILDRDWNQWVERVLQDQLREVIPNYYGSRRLNKIPTSRVTISSNQALQARVQNNGTRPPHSHSQPNSSRRQPRAKQKGPIDKRDKSKGLYPGFRFFKAACRDCTNSNDNCTLCHICNRNFPNWNDYNQHYKNGHQQSANMGSTVFGCLQDSRGTSDSRATFSHRKEKKTISKSRRD